jgi:hypothetical protein
MILFDNKVKIKWEWNSLIKWKIKKNLITSKSNVEGQIKKKSILKKNKKAWFESTWQVHGPIKRSR